MDELGCIDASFNELLNFLLLRLGNDDENRFDSEIIFHNNRNERMTSEISVIDVALKVRVTTFHILEEN